MGRVFCIFPLPIQPRDFSRQEILVSCSTRENEGGMGWKIKININRSEISRVSNEIGKFGELFRWIAGDGGLSWLILQLVRPFVSHPKNITTQMNSNSAIHTGYRFYSLSRKYSECHRLCTQVYLPLFSLFLSCHSHLESLTYAIHGSRVSGAVARSAHGRETERENTGNTPQVRVRQRCCTLVLLPEVEEVSTWILYRGTRESTV